MSTQQGTPRTGTAAMATMGRSRVNSWWRGYQGTQTHCQSMQRSSCHWGRAEATTPRPLGPSRHHHEEQVGSQPHGTRQRLRQGLQAAGPAPWSPAALLVMLVVALAQGPTLVGSDSETEFSPAGSESGWYPSSSQLQGPTAAFTDLSAEPRGACQLELAGIRFRRSGMPLPWPTCSFSKGAPRCQPEWPPGRALNLNLKPVT
jgi:hypothetical protein